MNKIRKSRIDGQSALRSVVGAALLAMGAQFAAAQTLPAPDTGFSVQYDDFHSYSTRVLDYRFPTAGWDASAGTGLLDVLITTRSSGQTNSDAGLAPYNMPDPITNPNTNPIDATTPQGNTWGGGGLGGVMLVKDLYAYLQAVFNANTPVFTFDQNETGGNPDLKVTAKVEILDGVGGTLLALWSLDSTINGDLGGTAPGSYNPLDRVTSPGTICVDPNPGDVGPQCFNNNVGSGKFDFVLFAPTMNLQPFADTNNVFKVTWEFNDVDDGGEEITLTGRFTGSVCPNPTLPQCQTIPEPGTLALGGLGLLGLALTSRRRWLTRG